MTTESKPEPPLSTTRGVEEEHNAAMAARKTATGKKDSWALYCASAGAAVWTVLALLGRIGSSRLGELELLFVFGPLVIVPLGMEAGRRLESSDALFEMARRFQPIGAGFAVASLWTRPGREAGVIALGWFVVCLIAAGSGVESLVREWWTRDGGVKRFSIAVARIDLLVGAAWLVASRLGMRPMGIQEPIGFLTAIHFHFAGFATSTLAAATVHFSKKDSRQPWLERLAVLVAVLPFLVAVGFVVSPWLKMLAAVLFSLSVAALAVFIRAAARRCEHTTAKIFLQIAAISVFAAMVLSSVYAVADLAGSDLLTIPQMARTHGLLNAVGFCMCGLLGWIVEIEQQS